MLVPETILSLSEAINAVLGGVQELWPELVLTGLFLVLVLLDLLGSVWVTRSLPYLTLLGLSVVFILQIFHLANAGQIASSVPFFHHLLIRDGIALYCAPLFSLAGMLTIFLSLGHAPLQHEFRGKAEYFSFIVVLILGLNLMVKSANLLMVFTSVELVSIASYLLTLTLRERPRSVEAGLKYILFGGFSAGVMVYGISFLYGFTGTLNFISLAFGEALATIHPVAMALAVVLTLAGFFFKISAAPFHFWTPDAYEGAPTPIAALFSTGPKIAATIVLVRFLGVFQGEAFAGRSMSIQLFVAGIALLTLVVGNFTALWQQRTKRLLAYSSVSHAGFLLVALSVFVGNSLPAVLFYLTVLLFMNFGVFLVVQVLEDSLHTGKMADYSGLGRQFPFIGVMALLFLLSLTGLPPTAGFMGKLFIFSALWQSYQLTSLPILLWLLVAGLLLTGVALFYYVRLPYFLFFKRNQKEFDLVISPRDRLMLVLLGIPVLLFFFRADWLMGLIEGTLLVQK
jgi:NADH-quinone oxidoreductase subunit N